MSNVGLKVPNNSTNNVTSNDVIIDIQETKEKIGTFVTSEGNKDIINIFSKVDPKGLFSGENLKTLEEIMKLGNQLQIKDKVASFVDTHFNEFLKGDSTENEMAKKYLARAIRKVMEGKGNNVDADQLSKAFIDRTVVELTGVKEAIDIVKGEKIEGGLVDKILRGLEVFINNKVDQVVPEGQGGGFIKKGVTLLTTAMKWVYDKFKIIFTPLGTLFGVGIGLTLNGIFNSLLTSKVPEVTTYGWFFILGLPPVFLCGTVGIVADVVRCFLDKYLLNKKANNDPKIEELQKANEKLLKEKDMSKKINALKDIEKKLVENKNIELKDVNLVKNEVSNIIEFKDENTDKNSKEEKIVINE